MSYNEETNITSRACQKIPTVVTTFKQPVVPQPPAWHARFLRRNATSKQICAPKDSQPHQRARYYDNETGEFVSADPLDYVDGMSLYRGYLVPNSIDPTGRIVYVYGWDGAGASIGVGEHTLSETPIELVYKVIAESILKDEVKVEVDRQWNLVYPKQIAAAKKIAEKAKTKEPGECRYCYPRIVLIGYSWGANTAAKVAALIQLNDPEVIVDLVFTIDPVFFDYNKSQVIKSLKFLRPFGKPIDITPSNFCRWDNYYQDSSKFPPFKGDQFSFATTNTYINANTLINGPFLNLPGVAPEETPNQIPHGADAGHVYIPYIKQIQQDWANKMASYKGNSSRDHYSDANCKTCK